MTRHSFTSIGISENSTKYNSLISGMNINQTLLLKEKMSQYYEICLSIHTDKEIKANRPDIVIKDKANNLCILIDVTVPSERNVAAKEAEKISKYKRS